MTKFNRVLQGARAVTGNALAPRSHRAGTNQINTYWSGLYGRVGADAFGGTGVQTTNVDGVKYFYTSFVSTGALTVTSAGTFEFKVFGGGGGGGYGNGYNSFGPGGGKAGTGNITTVLGVGTYTVTIGAGGSGPTSPTVYSSSAGTASSVAGFSAVAEIGAGGGTMATGNTAGIDGAGDVGTQVNTFIGGTSLFKAAGGGNSRTGIGGSGVGGNGGNGSPGNATSAAANTASGGGGNGGSSLPDLFTGTGGNGGSGIVYVRWRA
jgi:hypothetical protein